MPHQFPIDHVPEDQAKPMTTLNIRLALKIIPDIDILLEAGAKQYRIKVPQFLNVVFAIMEEMIVPSPYQIPLIHGSEH